MQNTPRKIEKLKTLQDRSRFLVSSQVIAILKVKGLHTNCLPIVDNFLLSFLTRLFYI